MKIKTGQTIYEMIVSVDIKNNPISAATLNTSLYRNGIICSDEFIDVELTDYENAIFTASWSATSYGNYQLYCKNETVNMLYISDIYLVVPDDEFSPNIFIGI